VSNLFCWYNAVVGWFRNWPWLTFGLLPKSPAASHDKKSYGGEKSDRISSSQLIFQLFSRFGECPGILCGSIYNIFLSSTRFLCSTSTSRGIGWKLTEQPGSASGLDSTACCLSGLLIAADVPSLLTRKVLSPLVGGPRAHACFGAVPFLSCICWVPLTSRVRHLSILQAVVFPEPRNMRRCSILSILTSDQILCLP
jgi:hypothetical protein